jgi:dipeptidyl aminopeptidase/acylaminoacyl peptidase
MNIRSTCFAIGVALTLLGQPARAERLPVGDFFKDPEFTSVSLSPTGEYITVSKPEGDRTLLAAFRVKDMKLVGKWDYGKNRHIDRVRWVNDERFLMYVSLKVGKFDRRVGTPDVYASNVDGTQRIDIPNGGFYQIVDITWDDPENVIVQRSIDSTFLFKMNVDNAKITTLATAPLKQGGFVLDSKRQVRYAVGARTEGITQVTLRRDGDEWTTIHETEMGGSVQLPLGFDREDKNVLFFLSDKGEPSRLSMMDPEGGSETRLSGNANVDSNEVLLSADDREILAVAYEDGLPAYEFINADHPESKAYAGLIQAFPKHAVRFGGISQDGRYILVRAYSDIDPGAYYLFDREKGQAKFLLAAMDWIKPAQMSPMRPIQITARDGVKLHGYLTIPNGSDGKNLPLILHPHGGPHGPRDLWGFNPEVQFLANRGYAVLQINFRGSGGYGNAFEKMGYRNWGTTMINDMTDAVDWAIAEGIADKDRLCTYGASYGGYAALQSVVRNPTKYACTIGYVGVYSLPLMFKDGDIPETDFGQAFLKRVMPESVADQQAQSAAYNIDKINIPVMLVQGAKDVRVPMSQYRSLKKGLIDAGRPPEVDIVEAKEAHGFYDYQNQVDLYTAMQAFLDKHLGVKGTVEVGDIK